MNNKLLNIYCARLSKDETKLNLTLVRGEGEQREFLTACIKLDSKGKVQAKIYDKVDGTKEVFITLPLSQKEVKKEKDDLPF